LGEKITFSIAALGALISGLLVVTLKNAFQAAVALIGTLISVALLFLLLAAPFVAVIQVIVYASAIVVLFLFVIAYMGERAAPVTPDRLDTATPFMWIAICGIAAEGVVTLLKAQIHLGRRLGTLGNGKDIGSPKAIGESFLNDYLVPFEATSLILLAAAVGAVMLAKRGVQAEGGR
jgi:NADH-quinone oxidoreductase subunit J